MAHSVSSFISLYFHWGLRVTLLSSKRTRSLWTWLKFKPENSQPKWNKSEMGEYWTLSVGNYSEKKKAASDWELLVQPREIPKIWETFCYSQMVCHKNYLEPKMHFKIDFLKGNFYFQNRKAVRAKPFTSTRWCYNFCQAGNSLFPQEPENQDILLIGDQICVYFGESVKEARWAKVFWWRLIWANRGKVVSGNNAFHHLHTYPSWCLKASWSPFSPLLFQNAALTTVRYMCVRNGTWMLRCGIER